MPAYNAADYIYQAVQGVISQTYTNIELIIIDDTHDDSCFSIINNICDQRIRYYRGRNQGQVAARNYGIYLANGTFIACMDADDAYHIQKIEKQINYLRKNNLQICGTWMRYFGNYNHRVLRNPILDSDIKFCMLFSSPIAHPTVLGYAELFKNNVYLDSAAEDYDLWSRLAVQGVKFGNIPEILTSYRIHRNQASNVKYSSMISDSIKVASFYSLIYNEEKYHNSLKKNNFLFNEKYSINEIKDLSEILAVIGKRNNISHDAALDALCKCFIKLHNPGFYSLYIYFRILLKNDISIFKNKNINIILQSIFGLKRDGFLYNILKRIAF